MLVWGNWADDHKWYLGIICETPLHNNLVEPQLYCHYADGEQDSGEDLQRGWKLHQKQNYPHSIQVLPLEEDEMEVEEEEEEEMEVEEEEEEDGVEEESGKLGAEGETEYEEEDGVEDEEEEEEENDEDEDEVEEEEEIFFQGQTGFRAFITEKFEQNFADELIEALKSIYYQEKHSEKSPVPGLARKIMAGFTRPDRLPTIWQQINTKELSAVDIVEKALKKTLEEPKALQERVVALEKHFASRMVGEEKRYVGYCGSMVAQNQLALRE